MYREYFLLVLTGLISLSFVHAQPSTGCRVDIAFVVDNSGSIRDSNVVGQPDNFNFVLDFMRRIVQAVTVTPDGNRFASVSFGNRARLDFLLNQYTSTQDVISAIGRIVYLGGNTNTTGALRLMRQQVFTAAGGDRPEVPNVCILITDGIPTREVPDLPGEVQANKNLGTRIIGIGVTKEVNETQLKTVVSNPATDYFFVSDFAGLSAILDGITNEACRTVSPPPAPSTTTSRHVEPSSSSAAPVTIATLPPGSCLVDIAFVVDNSGSIRDTNVAGQPDNFEQVKQFMRNIVQAVQVSPNGNHFACVSYGNTAVVNFYFNQYTTTSSVLSAIDAFGYLGGNTNTTGGLRLMRQDVFTQSHGDRPQVSNLCILITDGITTREVEELPNEVRRIKDLGTRIIGVGVSKEVNEQELKEIVTDPTTDYFYVSNFTGLRTLLDRIINSACQSFPSQPAPSSTSPGPTVPHTDPQPLNATTTVGRTLAPGTICDADISFVVDNSGSIRDSNVAGQPDNFELVLNFMRNIVQTITASPDGNRFASVSFGNDARVNFYFDTYSTTSQVLGGISSINYLGGNTNTTGALRLLRQAVFTQARGDRPEIPNICLLITDGTPTREVAELPAEVARIKAMGTRIVGVGVTRAVNETQLKSVVTNPATDYFYVNNFTGLYDMLDAIINSACQSPRPSVPPTSSITSRVPLPTTARDPSGNCANPVDIIFVLDDSGSIGYANYLMLKSFVVTLVDDFDVENDNVRVGVLTFSDNPEPRFNLNAYKTRVALKSAISNMTFIGGNTNTPAALRYVRMTMLGAAAGKRSGVPALVILVSDGGSGDKQATQNEAYALRNAGATVVVVGVGQWIDLMELNNIASYPYSDNTILVSNYNALPTIKQRLSTLACNGLSACSTRPCQNGGTCVQELQVYNCLCTTGHAGRNCQQSCREGADIAFIIDGSHLVGTQNFQKQLDFVRELVLSINVNSDSRVALLVAADQAQIRFNLNDFDTQLEILNAISQYYPSNQSDLAGAIRLARTQVFGSAGDRLNTPNIIVIITYRGSMNTTVAAAEATLARDAGAHILGIGIGSMVKKDELNTLVSYSPQANALYLAQPENILTLVNNVSRAMCNEVNECSSNPCQNGGQCHDEVNGYTCTCPDTHTGINCQQSGSGRIDLNIVVDASGSIRSERFPYVLQFISDLVEQLEVTPDKTRVGLIQYSPTARQVFRLNTYDNKQDVMQAVKAVPFIGGTTNAADALDLLVPGFTTAFGGRSDAPDVALVFSDGNWNQKVPDTVPAAMRAQASGIRILVFSVGTDSNVAALEAIASQPTDKTIFKAPSATDLRQLLNAALLAIINSS